MISAQNEVVVTDLILCFIVLGIIVWVYQKECRYLFATLFVGQGVPRVVNDHEKELNF